MPDVVGRSCDEAKAQMESNGLDATCTDQPTNDPNQVDKVISTTPQANEQVDPGSKVTIVVGKAVEKKKVPESTLGTPLSQALQTRSRPASPTSRSTVPATATRSS
ncbi:hypothetical protein STENM327S_05293 [Streptomyces tendae]